MKEFLDEFQQEYREIQQGEISEEILEKNSGIIPAQSPDLIIEAAFEAMAKGSLK